MQLLWLSQLFVLYMRVFIRTFIHINYTCDPEILTANVNYLYLKKIK